MERIKEALARARTSREADAASSESSHFATDRTFDETVTLERSFEYSHTKVIELNQEVLNENLLLPGIEDDEVLTAYKILRTQVIQRMEPRGWNTLAVTSPLPGQGKTLTAINLAVSLAREVHKTVLLVDLDLRNPSIHNRFGFAASRGIVDYLVDNAPISELLVHPGIERLVILPGCQPFSFSSELLSSPKMAALVEELRSRYPSRYIVFDLPPLLATDDAIAFVPLVDSTLLVLEDDRSRRADVLRSMEMLENTNILGTVLNRSSERQPTYY